jgi:hypothetical protein
MQAFVWFGQGGCSCHCSGGPPGSRRTAVVSVEGRSVAAWRQGIQQDLLDPRHRPCDRAREDAERAHGRDGGSRRGRQLLRRLLQDATRLRVVATMYRGGRTEPKAAHSRRTVAIRGPQSPSSQTSGAHRRSVDSPRSRGVTAGCRRRDRTRRPGRRPPRPIRADAAPARPCAPFSHLATNGGMASRPFAGPSGLGVDPTTSTCGLAERSSSAPRSCTAHRTPPAP